MIKDDIHKAIVSGSTINISYIKNDGTYSNRRLSDIEYSDEYGDSHIRAFCHMRNEYRTFKISRINSIEFLSESKSDNNIPQEELQFKEINSNTKYIFNSKKKVYPLYGEDYN